MRYAFRRALSMLSAVAFVAVVACAARRAESAAAPDRNVLTRADLLDLHYETAYDAVEALRSLWLQARGPDSFTNPSQVWVYLDNNRLGDVTTLRSVSVRNVARIQHLDGVEATARYGVGHGAGVIYVASYPMNAPPDTTNPPLETNAVLETARRQDILPPLGNQFPLASDGQPVPLVVGSDDFAGVIRAVDDLRMDVGKVTGTDPHVFTDSMPKNRHIVLVGTIGRNAVIDRLISTGKLSAAGVVGKWESYVRQVVDNPAPGVGQALVIAGSDKRGTIYGVYDVSSLIGVSPWHWWADVPPRRQRDLQVPLARLTQGEPAVKYRGIFINDEAPAFSGWTREKFGGVNHLVYTKMFELILRMKGNYLWPAMWGNAFADDDSLNPKLADEYGIVMGTSHHEPMTRAQQEWKRYGKGEWDYDVNGTTLREFWRAGIERMVNHGAPRENIVTLGMRGDGDRPMTTNGESNVGLLEKIVADQRQILREVTGKDPSKTPTLWALYKEVQDYYDKGMRVPDDVTLLFADDNWGNIRRLPEAKDRNRSGGFGVYYHFDYVGGPRNYKWINTNPIARVWEQMHLATEYGANRIWIVNVGDLKPMEFPIQFFLDYAWDPSKWPAERLPEYTRQWAEQQFGPEHAVEIADIVTKTLMFAGRRKPELLTPETYSLANYREAETVVADYQALAEKAEALAKEMAPAMGDAYYELVLHPVIAAATVNEMYVAVAKNHQYAQQQRSSTNDLADRARRLFEHDAEIANFYNTALAGGKWSHMMDQTHIGYTYWQEPPRNLMPRVDFIQVPVAAEMGVAWEGQPSGPPAFVPGQRPQFREPALPEFDQYARQGYYIDVYNKGRAPFDYAIQTGAPWVLVSRATGTVEKEQRVVVSVDWARAPAGISKVPVTVIGPGDREVVVQAIVKNPASPRRTDAVGFIEANGYVSMEAEHYTRSVSATPVRWLRIPDFGRTLSGMTVTPVDMRSAAAGGASARLEYSMFLFDSGSVSVRAYLSPTLNFSGAAHGLRYGVSIDEEAPQIVNITADTALKAWEQQVGDEINLSVTKHTLAHPGEHVLKFWVVDPGVVIQKLVVDAGGVKPSYLGPPESYRAAKTAGIGKS